MNHSWVNHLFWLVHWEWRESFFTKWGLVRLFTKLSGILWSSSLVCQSLMHPQSLTSDDQTPSMKLQFVFYHLAQSGMVYLYTFISICCMYGLFNNIHPTKWQQCWYIFHAVSFETRNTRGLMVPLGPSTSFQPRPPSLDMAQLSIFTNPPNMDD